MTFEHLKCVTLKAFSEYICDNSVDSNRWIKKITRFSYMDFWKEWLRSEKNIYELYKLFTNNNIIIAFQPFIIPDWKSSIVGILFYKKITFENSNTYPNSFTVDIFKRGDIHTSDHCYNWSVSNTHMLNTFVIKNKLVEQMKRENKKSHIFEVKKREYTELIEL